MYKKKYRSNKIRGKLKVCRYLAANASLRRYVPDTARLNEGNLRQMAYTYNSVYIKPDVGSMGIGIHKLTRHAAGYTLQSVSKRKQYTMAFYRSRDVARHVQAKQKQKMIVQQAIKLDQLNGSPYDIRAMVQRKPGGRWTCTGFLVKIGKSGKIVTNYYQGGKVITLRQLFRLQGMPADRIERRTARLRKTAQRIAKALSARRSGMHEMGIDFAYSSSGRLWVLEVNSNHPQFHPLRKIDRKSYKKMAAYARSYGRYDD